MSLFTSPEGSPLQDLSPAITAADPAVTAPADGMDHSAESSDTQTSEVSPAEALSFSAPLPEEAIAPLPGVYQMRTLQHLSRTLAEEEARFRQSAAWLERLQDACHHVATEAMGLFAVLEAERSTAQRLAEEIRSLSAQTLGAWPEQGVPERVALPVDELDVSESSFQKDPDMELTARQQHTESFHEMWDSSTAPEMPSTRRARRRAKKGF
jgi:hypothetical protein